jgi:hypothetical protein
MRMSSIHILLRNSIDYAGLFPPAGLDMDAAVDNYHRYRAGAAAWALGRFILPASRLAQFEAAAGDRLSGTSAGQPWLLSVLAGTDLAGELKQVAEFNQRHAKSRAARIDAVEAKATSPEAVQETMHLMPRDLQAYIEIPVDRDPAGLLAAIGQTGGRAKVRTGGVTRDGFPTTSDLLRFLQSCKGARVPFKATAGLHHPLRAEYPLTYEPDSLTGTMFGFLNLFLAAAFLAEGLDESNATRVLEEKSPVAFEFGQRGVSWQSHRVGPAALARARQDVIVSFGSCSFTEPIEELQALNLLQPSTQQA